MIANGRENAKWLVVWEKLKAFYCYKWKEQNIGIALGLILFFNKAKLYLSLLMWLRK